MCDDEVEYDFEEIIQRQASHKDSQTQLVKVQQRISKANYLKKVEKMLNHIHRGDIYEANFCMEFYAESLP